MRRLAIVTLVCLLAATGCTSSKHKSSTSTSGSSTGIAPPNSPVAIPTVTGPVTGGIPPVPVNAMPADLEAKYGYSEKEYLFSGTAAAVSQFLLPADAATIVARANAARIPS